MKKVLYVGFALVVYSSGYSQSKIWSQEFAMTFRQTDPSKNFIERFFDAGSYFFSPTNKALPKMLDEVEMRFHTNEETALKIVADSILAGFLQNHLWDEYPEAKQRNGDYITYYNQRLCPCISKLQSREGILDPAEIQKCTTDLIKDSVFQLRSGAAMQGKTPEQIMQVGFDFLIYSFGNCTPLRNHFLNIGFYAKVREFGWEMKQEPLERDFKIAQLYEQKENQDLKDVFPSYQAYEKQLSQLVAFFKENFLSITEEAKDIHGAVLITRTYYDGSGKVPILKGAVQYVLEKKTFYSPVRSIIFITPEKIKNKAALLVRIKKEQIDIQPPPPGPDMIAVPSGGN